jgi:hypothetical protein
VSKRKRGLCLIALAVEICLIGWCGWIFYGGLWWQSKANQRLGEQLVEKVEIYRHVQGRLPESLEDVGVHNNDLPVYYEKKSGDRYILWYGTTLGESAVFDSQTKKWE